ncbi:MAG: hypothetical protein ACLGIO_00980 [Acidimicrobiia bacterium]
MRASPGATEAVAGRMPALRAIACTSPRWSGVARETTTPSAPARAVRPERCR